MEIQYAIAVIPPDLAVTMEMAEDEIWYWEPFNYLVIISILLQYDSLSRGCRGPSLKSTKTCRREKCQRGLTSERKLIKKMGKTVWSRQLRNTCSQICLLFIVQ